MPTSEAPVVSAAALLDRARAAGRDLRAPDLTDLAALAEQYVAATGIEALLARIPVGTERIILGHLAEGPLLALRRYAVNERSSVHSHAWVVLVQLEGNAVFDRWRLGGDGRATLAERQSLHAGSVTLIGDGELHRQWARTDMVELVLIAHYDSDAPRVEYQPEPHANATAEFVAAFIDAYAAADAEAVTAHYAPGTFLDANVPTWRYQLTEPGAIAELLQREEFLPGYRLAQWHATATATGVLIEMEHRYGEGASQRLTREMHRLTLLDEGIVEHVLFCTGVWSPETIAKQASRAPMVRW